MVIRLWVLRIFSLATGALLPVAFLIPETHGPTILAARAARLRVRGRKHARAAHELTGETMTDFLRVHVGRPFGMSSAELGLRLDLLDSFSIAMFIREPIIQAAAAWTSLAYGIT